MDPHVWSLLALTAAAVAAAVVGYATGRREAMRRTLAMVTRHNRKRADRYGKLALQSRLTDDVALLSRVADAVGYDGEGSAFRRELAFAALRAIGSEEAVKVIAVAMAEHCYPCVDVEAHGEAGQEPPWYAFTARARASLRAVLPAAETKDA